MAEGYGFNDGAVETMDYGTGWISYEFRWAMESEWLPAMRMIWNTFLRYEGREYSKEGIHNFYDFITNDQLYFLFLQGKYQLMVALDKGRIIGAGSIRNGNQLSLLFVEEAYHHKGVGSALLRRLCEYLKTEAGEKSMFVQAAPSAVGFYRKQGFKALQSEMEISGIRVMPMEKWF